MKKIYSIVLAALAVCAVSCQEGPLDKPEAEAPQTGETMTFTASMAQTKTTLVGNKSFWVAGDKIKITSGETTIEFTSTLKEGETSETTTFTASNVPAGFDGPYTATYGQFNANQTAVANNYDPAVVELKAQSDDHNLYFTNTTALLKLNIQGNDNGNDINSVSFESGDDVVTLTGSKLNGVYYMAVQPKTYAGFDIKINNTVVKKNISGSFIPSASNIYNIGDVKHSNVFYRGENAGTNWNPGLEMIDAGNGQYVLFDVEISAGNQSKFFIPKYKDENGKLEDVWFGFNSNTNDGTGDIYLKNDGSNITNIATGTYNIYFKTNNLKWYEKRVAFVKQN